jgi:hypothetical protein
VLHDAEPLEGACEEQSCEDAAELACDDEWQMLMFLMLVSSQALSSVTSGTMRLASMRLVSSCAVSCAVLLLVTGGPACCAELIAEVILWNCAET